MGKLDFIYLKVLLILISSSFFIFEVNGQQDAQFTQYMYNGHYFNPAFAGKEGGYRFSALHRSQWLNYSGNNGPAPTTQLVSASGSVEKLKLGMGLNLVNDIIGPTTNQEVNLSMAYHKKLRMGVLSIGAMGGIFSTTLNYEDLEFVNEEPNFPSIGTETQMTINFGAGIIYDRGKYYLALSSRHINEPVFDFGEGSLENQLKNHSYLMAGYRIKTFALWEFEPSILLKTVSFNNFSYDVSVIATYNQKISGGLAFRGEESVSLLMGYSLLRDNSLRVGYAFDLVIGGIEAKAPSSHEFMLSYVLPDVTREFQRTIQRTPRFRF